MDRHTGHNVREKNNKNMIHALQHMGLITHKLSYDTNLAHSGFKLQDHLFKRTAFVADIQIIRVHAAFSIEK